MIHLIKYKMSHARGLAQILISKIGGNVDHTTRSATLEMTDNSIDAHCKNIHINTRQTGEDHHRKYHAKFSDDGDGAFRCYIISIRNFTDWIIVTAARSCCAM